VGDNRDSKGSSQAFCAERKALRLAAMTTPDFTLTAEAASSQQRMVSRRELEARAARTQSRGLVGVGGVPFYQDKLVTIYHGDAREIVPLLGRFDVLLTDPPYGIGYNAQKQNLPGATERKDIAGDEDAELARWLMGMLYVAKSACVFGANNFPGLLPHRGRWVCWDKRLTREADRMLGSAFEVAWTNRVSGYDKMVRVLHGGVVNANGGKRVHPTEKPVLLIREILESLYPDAASVLDPFGGSGTTARACKDIGRECVMVELEEEYCEAAAKLMSQECLSLGGGGAELGETERGTKSAAQTANEKLRDDDEQAARGPEH
jgi:site-specific DNA-methyltransferase (adenine-specific)